MNWTEKDKELLAGACADGARWALSLPGPLAVLKSKSHPDWVSWLARRYAVLGRALPEGLKVGGYLDLSGTAITALPAGLKVGGYLYLGGTPLVENIGASDWMTLAQVRALLKKGN